MPVPGKSLIWRYSCSVARVYLYQIDFTRGIWTMRLRLLFVLLVLAIAVPFAAADSILNLTINNIGISGSIGTVTLHQEAGGVLVTLKAGSGFSFKLNGGDVMFNSSASLSASNITGLMAGGSAATFQKLSLHGPAPLGKFDYDLRNMSGTGVSANTISFLITGVNISQLGNFGVHFCVGAGTNCGTGNTGFAVGGPAVPEPGTLSLLGTGILGLAGFFRRRLIS
jgi:hypothetical protein